MNDDDINETLKEKWSDRLTNYSESKFSFFESFSSKFCYFWQYSCLRFLGFSDLIT